MSNNILNKNYNGILIVKARNGNFNAGFDGNPRTLPNGTIFATDKALKYCIREYLALFEQLPIFVRRNRRLVEDSEKKSKLMYQILEENFFSKLKLLSNSKDGIDELFIAKQDQEKIKKWINDNHDKIEKFEENSKKGKDKIFNDFLEDDKKVLSILKSFIDVRLFGIVFAVKGNVSLTGPVQISYGVNKLKETSIFPVQILSPYKNPNTKESQGVDNEEKITAQTTIGEETRADEVYYAYNLSINAANAEHTGLTEKDLRLCKKALLNSVDQITSCTKYGCESVALVWLTNEKNLVLNNLDEFIDINKTKEGAIALNLYRLKDYLEPYGFNGISKLEHRLDLEYASTDDKKIELIYKKGKIEVSEDKAGAKEDK